MSERPKKAVHGGNTKVATEVEVSTWGRASGRSSEAGARLRLAIEKQMPEAGVRSLLQLAKRAGVAIDTLYSWFSGDYVPSAAKLVDVAEILGVTATELMAAYEGQPKPLRDPESLLAVVRRQTERVDVLIERLEWLLPLAARGIAEAAEEESHLPAGESPDGQPSERKRRTPPRSRREPPDQ